MILKTTLQQVLKKQTTESIGTAALVRLYQSNATCN